jgi:hypothetical protein
MEKDLEGSGRVLNEVLSPRLPGEIKERYKKPHSEQPVYRPGFETHTSPIQVYRQLTLHQLGPLTRLEKRGINTKSWP